MRYIVATISRFPRARANVRDQLLERRAIKSRKLAHVMEPVGPGARRHGDGIGSLHELCAGRPKLLETQIAMQAHAANARHRRAQRSDRDAALFGEVGAVYRRGGMKGDIVVDHANEAAITPCSQFWLVNSGGLLLRNISSMASNRLSWRASAERGVLQQVRSGGSRLQDGCRDGTDGGESVGGGHECAEFVRRIEPFPIAPGPRQG